MKFSNFSILLLVLLLFYTNVQVVLSAHPPYPGSFPSNEAYISQSTSCFTDDLFTWTCPPCEKTTTSYILLDKYSLSGIEQFIFVNQLYRDIVVAYKYSYSKEMKSQTLCSDSTQVRYFISSNTNISSPVQTCISDAEIYVSSYMNDILSSSSTTIVTVLDLFYQRIEQVIEAYPYQRNQLIFTGYEIGGSIAQVVNSYYMIRNTMYVSFTVGDVTVAGCLPENNVKLYQFGSPVSMNYVKKIIDDICSEYPIFSSNYEDTYWVLFNLVNYRDPVPYYPIPSNSNLNIQFIQSVYYEGVERVGYCNAMTDCGFQSPTITNYAFVLDNHYFIYNNIQFSPITSTNEEYCNLYPDQLRDYESSGTQSYFGLLCQELTESKTNQCIGGQCAPISETSLCDCTSLCSFRDSNQPNLPYECCMNMCDVCTNSICVGELPPVSNTGKSCQESIELEPVFTTTYISITINVNEDQPFGITRAFCLPFINNSPGVTVVWLKYTNQITAQYNFNTFSTNFGSAITIWSSCDVNNIQCLTSSNSAQGTDDGSVNIGLSANRVYYITLTSDQVGQLGTFYFNYALIGQATSFTFKDDTLEDNIIQSTEINFPYTIITSVDTISIDKNQYNREDEIHQSESDINSRDLIQSCSGRCGETGPTEIPGLCNCYSSCNPAIDPTCCSDICEFCTFGENQETDIGNEFCLAIHEGSYSNTCVGRCNESTVTPGCPCNLECLNNPISCCLDFVTSCPNAQILQTPQFLSCRNRCGKPATRGPNNEIDNRYTCSCTENCETLTSGCCSDMLNPDINCPNKHVRKDLSTVSNSCSGKCGQEPSDYICSCAADCQQKQNCCNDYCNVCNPEIQTCDLNTNQLNLPPTPYEKQKYFQLSISPNCVNNGLAKYSDWTCKSCAYYSGYTDFMKNFNYNGLADVFINYNADKKETIINIVSTPEYSFLNNIENLKNIATYSQINYGNTRCEISKSVLLTYFTEYYDIALAIDSRISIELGGYENYFENRQGGTLTFIGHSQGGSLANIIYDHFVMKRNIDRYYTLTGNCPTVEFGNCFAKYYINENPDNAIIIQGLTTSAPNIFFSIGRLQYDSVLGPSYNGNTTFNPQYRLFGVVNTFTFTSSILTGYSGFQTYYADPIGGIDIYPCNYYGSFCYPVSYVVVPIAVLSPVIYSYGYPYAEWFYQTFLSSLKQVPLPCRADEMIGYEGFLGVTTEQVVEFAEEFGTMGLYTTRFINTLNALKVWGSVLAASVTTLGSVDIFSIEFNFIRDIAIYFTTNDIDNTLFNCKLSTVCSITGSDKNQNVEFDHFIRKLIIQGFDNVRREYGLDKYNNGTSSIHSNRETINIQDVYDLFERRYKIDVLSYYNSKNYHSEAHPVINSVDTNSITNEYSYMKSLDSLNNTNSYIYTGDSTFITSNGIRNILKSSIDTLKQLSEATLQVLITDKPNVKQFDKYYDFMSIGFAPYSELQSFNCTLCQYYSGLGYYMIHWEHYTYYDLFWFSNSITKEVIILMSTDNYPQTIYQSVCENQLRSYNITAEGSVNSACMSNPQSYEEFRRFSTSDTEIMFPSQYFTEQYLSLSYTSQLMRNPVYTGYVYTYVGFGSASSYILDMYTFGFYYYNPENNQVPTNSSCPRYKVQAVLFSPLDDFTIIEETSTGFTPSENVKIFMNPCDKLPTLGTFGPNYYTWNNDRGINNLHSYYITSLQEVVDFNTFNNNEKNCIVEVLQNGTIINDYTIYPSHFTIGDRSPQYGFLRNAQQVVSNTGYESIVYQTPSNGVKTEICPLLQNYPYTNQSVPQIPLIITEPPLQLQQNKYYKLNLLSYGSYDQLNNKQSSWWSESDIQNYTIVEQQHTEDWVVTAYYSSLYNEVILSMMARNDTFLYGKSICNSTENVNGLDFIDTSICTLPTVPWLYNNINNQDYESYFSIFTEIQILFRTERGSTITFTGIGLGAGLHKAFLLHLMAYNPEYLAGNEQDFPYGSCILEANDLPRYQSIFYSSTRNQYYQDPYFNNINDGVVRNITMSKFFTTLYMSDDANFISAYDYLVIGKLLFPSTLGPLWVYYNNVAVPILYNGNVELSTTGESKFYNTYYNFESLYYNQSNWRIVGNTVNYIPASLSTNAIYSIPVSTTDESCRLLTTSNITEFNNTISKPPTLVQSEVYAYFSMLAYFEVSSIFDGSCLNLGQKGSLAFIIDTYQLTGYSENVTINMRVLYFTSQVYKSIIYAFAFTSTDETILGLECQDSTTNEFVLVSYNVGLNCGSSEIGSFYFKSVFLTYYDNWEPKALFRDLVRNDIASHPDYKLVITGHSAGGSIAHIAFIDVQVTTLMSRSTCDSNPNLQMIVFGEVPSTKNIPIIAGGNVLDTTGVFSMINECDAVPYLYPNGTGYIYWILNPRTGYTYTLNSDYTLHEVTNQEIAQGNYSSCPLSNGYSIEFNKEYIGKRSFVGYAVSSTVFKDSYEIEKPLPFEKEIQDYKLTEEFYSNNYNHDDYDIFNNGRATLDNICSNVINPTTRIDYRGPTKSQLSKYNKLMSYSYYPLHPVSQSPIPPYINPQDVTQMINDPQINSYMNNDQNGEFLIGYHKIVYYTSYTNKEFVISVVPLNTTTPYYRFSCVNVIENTNSPIGYANESYWYDTYNNAQLGNFNAIYKGSTNPSYNLEAIATEIRSIQQNIFESTILPGHGSKSDWTITFISKDTGNNAIFYFIMNYYYTSLNYENVGGINRYKVQNTGYKYFQTLGFGYILDKWQRNDNVLFDVTFTDPLNAIGKNIFMTVAMYNDKLNSENLVNNRRVECTDPWDACFIFPGSPPCYRCQSGYRFDKWHRSILYNEDADIVEDLEYYKCNKYAQFVGPDTRTVYDSDLNLCNGTNTITREYFGLPNYFFRYSYWNCGSTGSSCTYDPLYNGPFIEYDNPSFNICQP